MLYSDNLTDWVESQTGITTALNAIISTSDMDTTFLAAGDAGMLLSSVDGSNWAVGIVSAGNIRALDRYAPGNYCLVGDAGLVMFSDNITDWTTDPTGRNNQLNAVASYRVEGTTPYSILVAVGSGGVILRRTQE